MTQSAGTRVSQSVEDAERRGAGGRLRQAIAFSLLALFAGCTSGSNSAGADERTKSAIIETATQAVTAVREKAADLGRRDVASAFDASMTEYIDGAEAAAALFPTAADDAGAEDRKSFVYVGLQLALLQGTGGASGTSPEQMDLVDELLGSAAEEDIEDLDVEDFRDEVRDLIRPIAAVSLFSDPGLVTQLLPPGSPEAERFSAWVRYDDQSVPTVTLPWPTLGVVRPPETDTWNDFVDKLIAERGEGSVVGRAIFEIERKLDRFSIEM